MDTPLALVITDLPTVPRAELLGRLERARSLPPELRGRLAVQLRDPELATDELHALGRELRALTRELGASLVVNDRLDLALELEADGLHLGRRSLGVDEVRSRVGNRLWISVSCHGPGELAVAAAAGPDAVLLSPVFASPRKREPLGLMALPEAKSALPPSVALLALGGVTVERAAACVRAGADGVAAIRADLVAALPRIAAERRLGP
ncbi:MAG: thiamine phosphate synthase [Polyangiaceae bacterium]|nr:thiamine phosphate synthase [Polyangiaceae bacterium]